MGLDGFAYCQKECMSGEHMIYITAHSFDLCVVLYNYRARYRLMDPLDYDIC